jgi:RsiW-degrading membrane proteinase PrsW (M82 family)
MIDMEIDRDRLTEVLNLFVLWYMVYLAWKHDSDSDLISFLAWGGVFAIAAAVITVFVLVAIADAG